jgi:hypothetical protein
LNSIDHEIVHLIQTKDDIGLSAASRDALDDEA